MLSLDDKAEIFITVYFLILIDTKYIIQWITWKQQRTSRKDVCTHVHLLFKKGDITLKQTNLVKHFHKILKIKCV